MIGASEQVVITSHIESASVSNVTLLGVISATVAIMIVGIIFINLLDKDLDQPNK